jgi:hypothetical protein
MLRSSSSRSMTAVIWSKTWVEFPFRRPLEAVSLSGLMQRSAEPRPASARNVNVLNSIQRLI